MKKHRCDGKECRDYESEGCLARNHPYTCTRTEGHEGPHIACSLMAHDLVIWFDEDQKEEPNQ